MSGAAGSDTPGGPSIASLGDWRRSCYCGEVSPSRVGETVTVMGWVDRRRDLGNLIFLDLRDREGVVQIVADPQQPAALEQAARSRSEYVLAVRGTVVERTPQTVNPQLKTGSVEVRAREIRILNSSRPLPFPIQGQATAAEETRLRHRYLDLRRPRMQANLRLRHRLCLEVRRHLDAHGFVEIETPFLTRSTPEGARDYLVPSRLYPGQFYALPQSPQLFKQLLMVGGLDRYFQIVRCFRDEDLRADRQPEFTQVDIEMSFAQPEMVFELIESLMERLLGLVGVEVALPFARLTWKESMSRYGTDRPDTRFALELVDLGEAFAETEFRIFRKVLEEGGVVRGFRVPGGSDYSRRQLEELDQQARQAGAPALAWLLRTSSGWRTSMPGAVTDRERETLGRLASLGPGDALLLAAGSEDVITPALGQLRTAVGRARDLIPDDAWSLVWVHDFPLFEWNPEAERYQARHHPFTAPSEQDLERLEESPGQVLSRAYDLVLNGIEIGGGSIRIHRPEVQQRVFRILGISAEEAHDRFGFFLEALDYGAPPHGGIAMGLDRIAMLAAGEPSIRQVIAFPKTARAQDLMCNAPSGVSPSQLEDLRLRPFEECE